MDGVGHAIGGAHPAEEMNRGRCFLVRLVEVVKVVINGQEPECC